MAYTAPHNGPGYGYPQYPAEPYPQQQPPIDVPPEDAADEGSGVAFDIAAGTSFPLGLGPMLSLEVPGRILLQTEIGWMPPAYGSAIVGIISSVNETAFLTKVVEDALADSFVFRIGAGWRPFPSAGFEITGGYTMISTGADIDPVIVGDVVDGDLERRIVALVTEKVPVTATMHNFHVALGWRFLAADDHLVIRTNLGYTQTLAASSSVELPEVPTDPELQGELEPRFQSAIDELLSSDVKLPRDQSEHGLPLLTSSHCDSRSRRRDFAH